MNDRVNPPPPRPSSSAARGSAPPASRLELASWMMFDFANSSYTTVIITVAFSVYFVKAVVGESGADDGNTWWGIGIGISQVLVLLSAPVVGAIADHSGAKKRFLAVSFVGCVGATAALGLVGPGDLALGLILLVVSNFFFSSGENLIAAFLPEITTPDRMGLISGLGWALGYVGGLTCLLACFPFIRAGIGPENVAGAQTAFVVTAAFFFVGGLPTFAFLRERATARPLPPGTGYVRVGFRRVLETLGRVRRHRQLFRFLGVFVIYNFGVTVVISFAAIFADREVGLSAGEVMVFFMVVQVSSSLGALGFGWLQDRTGARTALVLSLALWLIVCVGAYGSTTATHLYVVGNLAGIAMGSAQSGARALVGTFSPPERSGEFFGFWGLAWKLSAALGPVTFGLLSDRWGMRPSILATAVCFALGIAGLWLVDERAGRREAEAAETA